jgi:transposase-like protein
MSEHDWSAFACPNPDCPTYGHQGRDNLRPHGWSSKERGLRCLRCTACGKNFSPRAGTPRCRTHLPEDRALAIARHLAEGNGMRPTSRLTGASLNTVLRFARRVGDHAREFHEPMVRHVEVNQVPVDEAWAFVGKKGQAR